MSQKTPIVVLVVVGVLFLIALIAGACQDDESEPDPRGYEPPNLVAGLGGLLAPYSPKVKVEDMRPIGCTSGSAAVCWPLTFSGTRTVSVRPSDEAFRRATFRLADGSKVTVSYDRAPTGDEPNQPMDLPRAGVPASRCLTDPNEDGCRGSVAIVREGGNIGLTCMPRSGRTTCVVALE